MDVWRMLGLIIENMSIWIVLGAFFSALAFTIVIQGFNSRSNITLLYALVSIACTKAFFTLLMQVSGLGTLFGFISHFICAVIIFLCVIPSIKPNTKNYIKGISIALSITIAFSVAVFTLTPMARFLISWLIAIEGHIFELYMISGILVSALIFRVFKSYFFVSSDDVTLLKRYILLQILILLMLNFGFIPLRLAIYPELELFIYIRFMFVLILLMFLVFIRYIVERIYVLERTNKIHAVELTKGLVEAENVNKRYDEIIKLKHYYTSLYRSIVEFIANKDLDGLENYYKENIAPINDQLNKEMGEYEQTKFIQIPLLKSRIVELINTISQLPNVKLYIHVENVISKVAMKDMDLLKVLNIYIENALEEVSSQEEGIITIQMTKNHDRFIFWIKNSLNGKDSTPKAENTGKGLGLIADFCKEYDNFMTLTDVQYGKYIQTLEVYDD